MIMKMHSYLPLLVTVWLIGSASHPVEAAPPPVTLDFTTQAPMNGYSLFGNGYYWWNNGNHANEVTPARTGQIAVRSLLAGRWLAASSSRTYFSLQSTSLRAPYQSVARNEENFFYFSASSGLRI